PSSSEEQHQPARLALCLGFGHGAGGGYHLLGLVPFGQREEEFALGTEVVVEAADAEARSLHHVGHGGLGEALLVEDLAGRIEKYLARLDSTTPLPGAGTSRLAHHRDLLPGTVGTQPTPPSAY